MEIEIKGKTLLIDDSDLHILESHAWHWSRQGYLLTGIPTGKYKRRSIGIHRIIMGDPTGMVIDHINRNPADNRRANLRICTYSENTFNSRRSDNPERGVTQRKGKWQVVIKVNGKAKWFGCYSTKDEAIAVAQRHYLSSAA